MNDNSGLAEQTTKAGSLSCLVRTSCLSAAAQPLNGRFALQAVWLAGELLNDWYR